MKDEKPGIKQQLQSIASKGSGITRYFWIVFICLIAVLYGYVFLKINDFMNTAPTTTQVSNNLKTTTFPTINQDVVNALYTLQNNSVSVQALFNQARSNPFQ